MYSHTGGGTCKSLCYLILLRVFNLREESSMVIVVSPLVALGHVESTDHRRQPLVFLKVWGLECGFLVRSFHMIHCIQPRHHL